MRKGLSLLVVGLCLLSACMPESRETSVRTHNDVSDWVMLLPDWKNDVVHKISAAGEYEGNLLVLPRDDEAAANKRAWDSPRALLVPGGAPGTLWLAAERALSEWNLDGTFRRAITTDSAVVQDPVAMMQLGDAIFVVSEDTKSIVVFNAAGEHVRSFGYPELDRATDAEIGPDGLLYVSSSLRSTEQAGLVSVWDPRNAAEDAKPIRHLVPPDPGEGGTVSAQSLAFDGAGNLLITDYVRGRVERWNVQTNERVEVLLDGGTLGQYKELERGSDGLIYLAGTNGVYRFETLATAEQLKGLEPFFVAATIADRYPHAFSPQAIVFVNRSALRAAAAR